ncbi:hypothetical protein A3765_10540 [Oleiphilus sp. HI0130]|nr:hypothetical protein A3765_10540 [Oleiphilus sp. HI0130]
MADWTPAEITTEIWLDADDLATLTVDGSNQVSQWNDKSTNARNLTADVGSLQPLSGTQTLNGKNAIRFRGVTLSIADGSFLNGKTSLGAVVVFDNTHSAIENRHIFSSSPDNDKGFCFRFDSAGFIGVGTNVFKTTIQSTNSSNNLETSNGSANFDPTILAARWDVGAGLKARINGDNDTPSGEVSTSTGVTTNNAFFKLGGGYSGNILGNIAELIVFDGISEANLVKLEGYLAHKWGLAANLPSGHTYKAAAPTTGGADTTPPVVTVVGANPLEIVQGDAYFEYGATVTDDNDSGLTATPSAAPNTNVIDTYTVTYTATDSAGNVGTATRIVNVVETPSTTLKHDFEIFLNFEDAADRTKDITSNDTTVTTTGTLSYTSNSLGNNVADLTTGNAYFDYSTEVARFAALDQIAVSVDFQPNAVGGVQAICGWSVSTAPSSDLLLFMQDSSLVLQLRINGVQQWRYQVTGGVMTNNTNYNVCFSCGSEGPKLWINGALQDAATYMTHGTAASTESLSTLNPDTCRVGMNRDNGGNEYGFRGYIKDFVVANTQFDQNTVDDIQAGFYGYELLALWGQSNAIGRATLRGGTDDNYSKVANVVYQYGYNGQTIAAATNPLDHVNEQSNDMGLWLSLCNELVDILPYKRRILLAPCAQGGTSFANNHWNVGDTLYETALSRTNAALAENRLSRVAMMHWLQGESDADNGNTTYLADLTTMQSDAYTRLNGYDASTPFVCVSIKGSSVPANVSVINGDLQSFANSASNRHYVDATDLTMFDSFHYDAASLEAIGLRSFEAVYGSSGTGSAVSNALGINWNMLQLVNGSLEARWSILQTVANSTRIDWALLQQVISNTDINWAVFNNVNGQLQIDWNAFGLVSGGVGIDWNLLQAATTTLQLDWSVLQQAQSGVELRFNVLQQAQQTLGIQYDIRATVDRSFSILWDNPGALNSVNSSLAIEWSILNAVTAALETEWNLLQSLGVSLELRHNIAQQVAQAIDVQYSVLNSVASSMELSWNSIAQVNGALELDWSIQIDGFVSSINTMVVTRENRVMTVLGENRVMKIQ